MSYRVLLSTPHPNWPLLRQLPGQSARMFSEHSSKTEPRTATWDDWTFIVDEEADEVDAWVVLEDVTTPQRTKVSPQNTLLLTGEPPSMRRYRQSYLQQFAHVITCHASLANDYVRQPDIQLASQGLPWHIGVDRLNNDSVRFAYDDFATAPQPTKRGLISVVCSNKTITRDHRARLEFVRTLQQHFGNDLCVFGRGFKEIGDKWDAIAPFQYHIVLENDSVAHYFSEKLTDCFLAQTYPIYYGCPNVDQYFSTQSLTPIDIHQPAQAISSIQQVIDANLAQTRIDAVRRSRDLVLNEYNLFAIIRNFFEPRFAADRPQTNRPVEQTLYPRRHKWSLQWAKLQRFHRRLVQAA